MQLKQTKDILNKFAKYVIQQSRTNLTKNKKNSTKALYNSLDFKYKAVNGGIGIKFLMDEYGIYQDKGVSGKKKKYNNPFSYKDKMPPSYAFDKWEVRKGHDVLAQCFNAAFGHSDDVELWMMCHNPFYSAEQQQQWEKLYKDSPLGDKIRIIPRQKTHTDVYNIMKQTDCGVFPARAEGWNLELLEMMACGKHVIATEYSAHTEFCNDKNCNLISIDNLEPAQDGVWFHGQGMWASLGNNQLEQIVNHMRRIHKEKQENLLESNIDGIYTAKEFSWKNSAEKFIKGLE